MSSEPRVHPSADLPVVSASGLSKCYQIYERPEDRLKQALFPRAQRFFGRPPRQYFSEFWALRDIGFDVYKGETLAVIGTNGSGKSTLLQLLCGTLRSTLGTASVRGRIAALLELGSGFNPEFTGRENVYLNGSVLGLTREQVAARFDQIAAFADIGDFIDQPVKTYSSGMYVRLAFAVIANVDADVLVVDEALSVGDVFFSQKCMRFLREFKSRGTLLFVSHDTSAVTGLCDRAIWLDHGRMVMDGSAKDVCNAYLAQSLYGLPLRQEQPETAAADEIAVSHAGNDATQLRVFRFAPATAGFGDGRARITGVQLLPAGIAGSDGPLGSVAGGESVCLRVEADVLGPIASPVCGFFLKDRLGQQLFGTNTWLNGAGVAQPVVAGEHLVAEFTFQMPHLPKGRYTFDVAIADGNHFEHVQNAWRFDALVVESVSSTLSGGLVGIPYQAVRLSAAGPR